MDKIQIDPEFKNLIPPLIEDDRARLEQNLINEGCRDALVLWGNILVDGHNRYKICLKHNIPYKTTQIEFADRNEAMLWMIENQMARRNLCAADRILLAQKKRPILQEMAKAKQKEAGGDKRSEDYKTAFAKTCKSDPDEENQGSQPKNELSERLKLILNDPFPFSEEDDDPDYFATSPDPKPKNTPEEPAKKASEPIHVRDTIAKDAGVSSFTVAKFEKVQKEKPELVDAIRNKDLSIDKAYNQIKNEEKQNKVRKAEQKVQAQVAAELKAHIKIGDSIKNCPTEKYDLLLTDPPYSTDVQDINAFVNSWLYNALDGVKDTGFAYIFIGAYPDEVRAYLNAKIPQHMTLCQQLIWTYKNTLGNNPKDRYKQNYQVCLFYRGINAPNLDCPLTAEQWAVQEINAPDGRQGDRYHTWQKPMQIAERFIRHSTKPGMTVYDPFACTGTFLLAAAKLGRKSFGYEINPDNAHIAESRGCVVDG